MLKNNNNISTKDNRFATESVVNTCLDSTYEMKYSSRSKVHYSSRFVIVLFFILSLSYAAQSQVSRREVKADSYFEIFSFHKAIATYLRVDDLTLRGHRRLAESYRKTGQFLHAERIYENIVIGENVEPEDLFNYISVLLANGKYAEAGLWIERFHDMAPEDLRARSFITNLKDLPNLIKEAGRYRVENLDINGPYQDFGTAHYQDMIVFASTRKPVKLARKYSADNQPFLDLYLATIEDNALFDPRPFFENNVNKRWHEGPASFALNGDMIAFTRSSQRASDAVGAVNLEIFFATKNRDGSWSNPVPFRLNNPEYSVSHPFILNDGNTMYFSSNMPGGKGGVDIYRIRKSPSGVWDKPENLGETINTEGDELFPFFHEGEQILIYSSNSLLGLGGLDIFLARQMGDGSFSYPRNGGAGLNSRFDDFALMTDSKMKTGYFSSNRSEGRGGDDIYFVEFLKPFVFGEVILGMAIDKNRNPIPNANINLYDEKGSIIQNTLSSETGRFEFVVNGEQKWKIVGNKEGYFNAEASLMSGNNLDESYQELVFEKDPQISLHFVVRDKLSNRPVVNARIEITNRATGERQVFLTSTTGEYNIPLPQSRINHNISFDYKVEAAGYLIFKGTYSRAFDKEGRYNVFAELGLSFIRVEPGKTRLEELINIKKIDFDTYRHTLSVETIAELEKVITILNDNPTMAIEVGSHTDCRGSTQLNQQLSERRAQAMADYIRSRISNPRRVTFKGYGRTVLVNDCDCFLTPPQFCTEEQHAENRRTEFVIVRM